MIQLGEALGVVAPYYNLVFVLVVLVLFSKLVTLPNKKIYLSPWKLLFLAVGIYIVEEISTVLNISGIISTPRILNGVFEFFIITIFIYLLLLQRKYLQESKINNTKGKKKKNAK